jgi:hypothetical protein
VKFQIGTSIAGDLELLTAPTMYALPLRRRQKVVLVRFALEVEVNATQLEMPVVPVVLKVRGFSKSSRDFFSLQIQDLSDLPSQLGMVYYSIELNGDLFNGFAETFDFDDCFDLFNGMIVVPWGSCHGSPLFTNS